MLVVLTGASGHIGGNLTRALLEQGRSLRALVRPEDTRALAGLKVEQVVGDLLNPASLERAFAGAEVVYHLAARISITDDDDAEVFRVNVEGTRNVVQACRRAGVRRLVHFSSVHAYHQVPLDQPIDETRPLADVASAMAYDRSKAQGEAEVMAGVGQGLDAVIVNPAVIMGPRDVNVGSGSILTEFRKHAIAVYPPGGVSVIDVGDVAFGHIAAAERGRTGARYILSGQNLWHKDVLGIAAEVVGRPRPWLRLPRFARYFEKAVDFARRQLKMPLPISGDQVRISTETWWYDNTKARTELGLNPRPWREACERAWAWYQQHGIV